MRCRIALWLMVAAIAISLAVLFNHWAPGQPLSLLLYAGLTLAFAGLINAIIPLRFLGARKRSTGLLVFAGGLVIAASALAWPAGTARVEQAQSRLDAIMPEYQFSEKHMVRVHSSPERLMEAIRQTTFGDIPAYSGLMRMRNLASGQGTRARGDISHIRILDVMKDPRSGFLPLDETATEIVNGMAGRPWSNARQPGPRDLAEFNQYRQPDSIRVAFNLRVEDQGAGWCKLITETRVLAADDAAKGKMKLYWRAILPGSGLIRRQWINSIRNRAESAQGSGDVVSVTSSKRSPGAAQR